MKKIWKGLISAVLTCLILTVNVSAIEISGELEYRYIHDLVDFIGENAKYPEDEHKLLDIALKARLTNPEGGFNGMVEAVMGALDEHSGYMTEETYNALLERSVEGEFTGIGVTISITNDAFVVVSAMPDSPAAKAGIGAGDILVAVDDVNIENEEFEAVRAKITGVPGTTVKITVRRGEKLLDFTVLRAALEIETVAYEIMDGVGYIQLSNFNVNSEKGVREALDYFTKNGIQDVIMDLRDNPGGELNAALAVCRLFTPKGVIMRVEYANSKHNQLYYNAENNAGKYNLAVLVNGGSASASELFSGAIKDTSSGVLIGTKTFGKGTVQNLMPIITGGGIRLTVAEYKTAGGRKIHHIGIDPDIYVENTSAPVDTSYMKELVLQTEWKEGDEGEGVLAVEQRLAFWGYMEEADTVFDAETASALRLFQAQNGLHATGTADIYAQIRLHDADYSIPIENDDQLAAALEYLKNEA